MKNRVPKKILCYSIKVFYIIIRGKSEFLNVEEKIFVFIYGITEKKRGLSTDGIRT